MDPIATTLDIFTRAGTEIPRWFFTQWWGISLWQFAMAFVFITLSLFARKMADVLLDRLIRSWLGTSAKGYPARII